MLPDHPSKNIESLVELSSLINSSLEIVEVLSHATRFVERVLDTEGSSIFELDETTNELFFRVLSSQDTHKAAEVRLKMGEGIAGWVARTGEAVIVPDTAKDPCFTSKVDGLTGFKTRSLIALPIRNKGRLIGVKDNGPGIAPEDLPRIFDPFFTVKSQGSGLGLTTVNRIVTAHRGHIKVCPELGAGTEFKLYLPTDIPPLRIRP